MKIEVHDADYEPSLRGRPRLVDITDLLQTLTDNPGVWCRTTMGAKDAGSVVRQLKKYEDIEVATQAEGKDKRVVLARTTS